MTEKAHISTVADLVEERNQLVSILTNPQTQGFKERLKGVTELVNDLLMKTHESKSDVLRLLPPVEIEQVADAVPHQNLYGGEPGKHYSFRSR